MLAGRNYPFGASTARRCSRHVGYRAPHCRHITTNISDDAARMKQMGLAARGARPPRRVPDATVNRITTLAQALGGP